MISRLRKIKSGILLSLLATFFFSLSYVFSKLASPTIPFAEVAFFRSFVGLVIVLFYMLYNGYAFKVHKQRVLFLRGLLGGAALLCSFYAISRIKLGEVSILFQLTPVFVAIFAHMILRERLPRFFYLLLITSLAGCVLVIKPSFANLGNIPALVGVLSAVLASLAYVCIRALTKEHKTHVIVLYFSFTAMLVPLPWVNNFVIPNHYELFILIMTGIVATAAQFLMTKAYSVEKAGVVSMVSYSGVLFNVCWGIIIWSEYLDFYSIVGGMLILTACVVMGWLKYEKMEF